jgi:tetraacyldisaccharide 4'-kinase
MIRLTAPRFWFSTPSWLAMLLTPLSWVWQLATWWRFKTTIPYAPSIKTICVGNSVVGGTGKTPLSIALFAALQEQGIASNPCFLTRGYRAGAQNASDEARLLAQYGTTIVAKDRVKGLKQALESGHDVAIIDDGFQNPSFVKDFSILVFDGARGIGNSLCLPAGPNRELLENALKRADAVMIIGPDETNLRAKIKDTALFTAQFKTSHTPQHQAYMAFAGIGRPQKFFDTLTENNFNVIETRSFPDHHHYSNTELQNLITLAKQKSAQLITTEKDFMRLPENIKPRVLTLPVSLEIQELDALLNLIRKRLNA